MDRTRINGVLPPMITPFTEKGDVDYDAFAFNVEKWNKTELAGYLVLGSNGETAYLNEEEKEQLIKITVETAAKDKFLVVGSGLESVSETIKLTNKAAKYGIHSALVLTPSYYGDRMTSAALVDFFTRVADSVDIPIMLYNVPMYTHVDIKADAVEKLSRHPNIIGMKDSKGDVPQLATFKRVTPELWNLMTGTANAWYPALTLGIRAGILALANILPNECVQVKKLFDAGKWEEARALYQRVFPVNTAVSARYHVAGLKHAATLLGYRGGYVRCPLEQLSEPDKAGVAKVLEAAGVL